MISSSMPVDSPFQSRGIIGPSTSESSCHEELKPLPSTPSVPLEDLPSVDDTHPSYAFVIIGSRRAVRVRCQPFIDVSIAASASSASHAYRAFSFKSALLSHIRRTSESVEYIAINSLFHRSSSTDLVRFQPAAAKEEIEKREAEALSVLAVLATCQGETHRGEMEPWTFVLARSDDLKLEDVKVKKLGDTLKAISAIVALIGIGVLIGFWVWGHQYAAS